MVRLAMYEKNAKAQAICESDETDKLEELITDFMSDSNDTYSDAESIFEICINKPNPDVFANKLYHVLSSSLDHNSCTISAILLRKILINKFEPPFLSFPVETQLTLKRKFLELVDTSVDTPTRPINKELCRTVSALAASLLPTKEWPEFKWPEFLSFLSKLVTSDKKRAWLIGAHLTQYLGKRLKELYSVNLEKELHSVLLQCLTEGEGEDVRIAVWGAAINFILCLEQKDLVNFQDLLTAMMSTLKNALCSGNETIADAVHTLKLLINLAGMKPTSLRKQIVEMVKTILLMADDHSLEKETRRLAIDFVLTLIQFVLTLADVEKTNRGLLKLGMEFEINMELWEFDEETVNYGLWQRCVDGMLILWDRKDILTVALEVLPAYLDAPEWQKKHAAFIVLTQSIKSCLETQVMIENLEKVVPMVLNPFPNAQPHMRCAAIEAIQQLFTPLLRFRMHEEVMRTNFELVMSKLLSSFQDDDPVVQNASIRAIEVLALTLGEHLQVGCHLVLPALAEVMNDSPNEDIRGSAASAILVFSEYCTRDNLREHLDKSISSFLIISQEVKQVLAIIRGTVVYLDSPSWRDSLLLEVLKTIKWEKRSWHERFSQPWVQIWRNEEQKEERDFSPYLEMLMSPVFDAAQLDPHVIRIIHRYDILSIMEKAEACHLLCFCVDELTELLAPEINRVVDTLIPFLKWYHDPPLADAPGVLVPSRECYDAKTIRMAAVSAMPKILNSAREVVNFSDPEDYAQNMQYVKMLSDKVKRALGEAAVAESDTGVRLEMLDSIEKCKQVLL